MYALSQLQNYQYKIYIMYLLYNCYKKTEILTSFFIKDKWIVFIFTYIFRRLEMKKYKRKCDTTPVVQHLCSQEVKIYTWKIYENEPL